MHVLTKLGLVHHLPQHRKRGMGVFAALEMSEGYSDKYSKISRLTFENTKNRSKETRTMGGTKVPTSGTLGKCEYTYRGPRNQCSQRYSTPGPCTPALLCLCIYSNRLCQCAAVPTFYSQPRVPPLDSSLSSNLHYASHHGAFANDSTKRE